MPSAACVVWSKYRDDNPFILAGIESRYVRDTHKTVDVNEIRKRKQPSSFTNLRLTSSQQYSSTIPMVEFESVASSDIPETTDSRQVEEVTRAKIIFAKRAVALEELYGTRVQFDTPSFHAGSGSGSGSGSGVYRVNFRWTRDATHFGITKGQIEGDETPLQAIVREIGEETGVKLTPAGESRVIELGTQDGCTFFSLQLIDKDDVTKWKETITGRLEKRHGELFNLAFVPMIHLDEHFKGKKMNHKTKIGLNLFLGSLHFPGRSVSSAHSDQISHGHAHPGKGGRSRRLRSKKRLLKRNKRAQKSKKRTRV